MGSLLYNRRKTVIITMLTVFLMLCLLVLFFNNDFRVKYFEERIEITLGEEWRPSTFEVYYGNLFMNHSAQYHVLDERVDTGKIGEYIVQYRLTYQGKEKILKQKIVVTDKFAPELKIDTKEIFVCPNGKVQDIEKKAIDNMDGDITDKIRYDIEDDYILFYVTDSSGNRTEKRLPVTVGDLESPQLTLKGDKTIYIPLNGEYQESGYSVLDNCDADLVSKVKINGEVNTKKVGRYEITYSVEDTSGNIENEIRTVYVYDPNNGSSHKVIYLTFDDGPSAYTGKLLDILKKYDVKATFFVTNQGLTKGYDSAIKRAYEEGHTIGLHTSTHNYKKIYASEEDYFRDLYEIQRKVKEITGHNSAIIRFPGGSSNTVSRYNPGIMSRLTRLVGKRGFRYFDWNLDSEDAGGARTSKAVANNVINGLNNGTMYMVLQHDIKEYSVDAVEEIIQYGLAHGYTFRAITKDTPDMHHKVNN